MISSTTDNALLQALSRSVPEFPRQLPVIAMASLELASASRSTHVAAGKYLTLLLKHRSGGIWESLVPGGAVCAQSCDDTIAQEELMELLTISAEAVNASAVYFPLVYNTSRAQRWLSMMPTVRSWKRPGSPSVAVERFKTPETVFAAASVRRCRAQKWAQELQCEQVSSTIALDTLRQIENHSWKKSMGCSIFDGEEGLFDVALGTQTYTAWVARYKGEPIAYRIDAGVESTMYAMEWSYDQRFRQFAPGAFITLSSIHHAHTMGYHQVDLYGNPDRLKCSIETHRRPRTDYLWIRQHWLQEHEKLQTERRKHDQGLDDARQNGVGIARYYGYRGRGLEP